MKTKLPFLIILLFAVSVNAQDQATPEFVFDHVALSVTDLNRSAGFYMNVLHLKEITNRTEVEGIRWFSLGEGKELHLISLLNEEVILNKAVHFALTTSAFDAYIANLDRKGLYYTDWYGSENTVNTRVDGVRQIYIQDPDGYWIEINSVGQL